MASELKNSAQLYVMGLEIRAVTCPRCKSSEWDGTGGQCATCDDYDRQLSER